MFNYTHIYVRMNFWRCVLPGGNCEATLAGNVVVTVAAGDVKCADEEFMLK